MVRKVITTAQANVRPHKQFFEGLQSYCKENNAELIVLPTIGMNASEQVLRPALYAADVLSSDKILNDNLMIQLRHIRPQMIDPATGQQNIVRDGRSVIFESPQIRVKAVATENVERHPRFLITTGACTMPNYADKDPKHAERRRLGRIARDNHRYAAVVVDIVDKKKYHFRHIQANSQGRFIDLGTSYHGKKRSDAKLEAMILGDWHRDNEDKSIAQVSVEMAKEYKPSRIILHDFFDGHSVNHHMQDEFIYQQIREGVDKDHLNLEKELKSGYDKLCELSDLFVDSTIYLVACNHHEFLNRWLDEGRYARDPKNARLGFKLAHMYADGWDPVHAGYSMMGKIPGNIVFLDRDASMTVRGWELAKHGDKGPSGGRGSLKTKEPIYGKSITGHTHSHEQYHDVKVVGTQLPRNMFYMKGSPNRWTHTNALLWDNGAVQMLNIIDGKYKA